MASGVLPRHDRTWPHSFCCCSPARRSGAGRTRSGRPREAVAPERSGKPRREDLAHLLPGLAHDLRQLRGELPPHGRPVELQELLQLGAGEALGVDLRAPLLHLAGRARPRGARRSSAAGCPPAGPSRSPGPGPPAREASGPSSAAARRGTTTPAARARPAATPACAARRARGDSRPAGGTDEEEDQEGGAAWAEESTNDASAGDRRRARPTRASALRPLDSGRM